MLMRFRATLDTARMLLVALALPLTAFVAPAAASGGEDGYYLQTDDKVVMEVEHAPPAGDWEAETSINGYTGDSYYAWRGPDHFESPGHGILEYRFMIVNSGTHYLKVHNRRDKEGTNAADDRYNDMWVRIDNGPWEKVFSDKLPWSVWNWITKFDVHNVWPPASYNLSAGLHTMQISGRSQRFKIDRIQFTRNSSADPSTSEPISPWIGDGGGSDPTLSNLTLVNAATDNDIRTLNNNATIDLDADGDELNIRANPGQSVGSVEFFIDGQSVKMESLAPYAMGGDVGGDYDAYPFEEGSFTLTAVPYSGSNGSGVEGEPLVINFNVVNDNSCSADVDGDNSVDVEDLMMVLSEWGPCSGACDGDTNGDNTVDVDDILKVLAEWGSCS